MEIDAELGNRSARGSIRMIGSGPQIPLPGGRMAPRRAAVTHVADDGELS